MKPGPAKYETRLPITWQLPSISYYGVSKVPSAHNQNHVITDLSFVVSAPQHSGVLWQLRIWQQFPVQGVKIKRSHYRPGHALRLPGGWGSQISRHSAQEYGKVVSITHRPSLPRQEILLLIISVKRLSQPQGHSATGRIMSMKISNGTIGNRTRDLPACSAANTSCRRDNSLLVWRWCLFVWR